MNQEQEMTQIVNPDYDYTAPKVSVVEIKPWRVMCGSPYDADSSDSNPENLNF